MCSNYSQIPMCAREYYWEHWEHTCGLIELRLGTRLGAEWARWEQVFGSFNQACPSFRLRASARACLNATFAKRFRFALDLATYSRFFAWPCSVPE